jgi:uncharacterized membrane protein HdeD (DUF308 family)
MNTTLLHTLAANWWILLLRGIVLILFGVIALGWPHITLLTLILLYGISAAIQGGMEIAAAIRGGAIAPRWWLVLTGLLALGAAAVTFLAPHLTALVLLYIIGAWAVTTGIIEIIGAIQLRKVIDNEWLLILSGVVSVAFGLFAFLQPRATALTLIWLIGAYAIVVGVIHVGLSFRLRRHRLAT